MDCAVHYGRHDGSLFCRAGRERDSGLYWGSTGDCRIRIWVIWARRRQWQGLSQLAYEYKNLFGIKYFSGDKYAIGGVDMSTGEETGNGNTTIIAGFSVYPDYGACIRQRGWMLSGNLMQVRCLRIGIKTIKNIQKKMPEDL